MNKNIKTLISVFMIISFVSVLFTACKTKNNNDNPITTNHSNQTQPIITQPPATDYTYNNIMIETKTPATQYVHTIPAVPTFEDRTNKTANVNATQSYNETTKNNISAEKPEDIFNDILLITKSSPITRGNNATIIIQGTPRAQYSIEFYKNNSVKADYQGLNVVSADSSGFASWTFTVENDCEIGDRKIIIKEKNSNKFIQTSITVQ